MHCTVNLGKLMKDIDDLSIMDDGFADKLDEISENMIDYYYTDRAYGDKSRLDHLEWLDAMSLNDSLYTVWFDPTFLRNLIFSNNELLDLEDEEAKKFL